MSVDTQPTLFWINPSEPFPEIDTLLVRELIAPGLLCAGADLSPVRLVHAYANAMFPWFSDGQPILWWSPDPRMVLKTQDFKISPSFKKRLKQFIKTPGCDIRFDTSFAQVIRSCASSPRNGHSGTWIVPEMIDAYIELHRHGIAHSVETWVNQELVGGLYFVSVGQAVFGESMFHRQTDASKIALAALVATCIHHNISQVDCQQNTRHLASFGAKEVPRSRFADEVQARVKLPAPNWNFAPIYWAHIGSLAPFQSDPPASTFL